MFLLPVFLALAPARSAGADKQQARQQAQKDAPQQAQKQAPKQVPRQVIDQARGVLRGERISLSVRVGIVTATVQAEALQDGNIGEIIRVKNLQTGRVQMAKVTREGQVEVPR